MFTGIFSGLNHHHKTVIFGGALMYDECADSFAWVFESLLRCMGGKKPTTFMTDQAPAIASAVSDVFPDVFHALCSWHIKQNGLKNLGASATPKFKELFNHLVNNVDNEAQFQLHWDKMLVKCKLDPNTGNSWLKRTHNCREQWSSAWVKNTFTAGKTTTQLSEQLNAYSRFYLGPDLNLQNFFKRFHSMVSALRDNELKADFDMINNLAPNRHKHDDIMNQAAAIFTPEIF